VAAYAERKLRALLCHASQLPARAAEDWQNALHDPAFVRESFRLARSTVGQPTEREEDLFRGLR